MYLNCHSHFSFKYGVYAEKTLLEMAKERGLQRIALTDINNTSACLNFIRLGQQIGIQSIVGVDFRTHAQQHFVALAKNNAGYAEINRFLSHHLHQNIPIPAFASFSEDVAVIYPYHQALKKDHFAPNEYIGIDLPQLTLLPFSPLNAFKNHWVLMHPVSFRHQKDYNAHRLMRAMHHNILLSHLPPTEQGRLEDTWLSETQETFLRKEHAAMVYNTDQLLSQCEVYFDFSPGKKSQNLQLYTDHPQNDMALLQQLCQEGLRKRYKVITPEIEARVAKELDMVQKMNFVSFFLINWDIISYAQKQQYFHVGRGSGANSILAYLLGISDVDPIELKLYFERFLNLYRNSPPDFDIDFSSWERDDVTQYIFDRFGKSGQCALLSTYNTYQRRAGTRELGKVFGLPKEEIDALSRGSISNKENDQYYRLVMKYSQHIQDCPSHLSVHAGGVLIAQKPIHHFSATSLPPKGFPITQFDMLIAEDVGLHKFDILGQRGLSKIKTCIDLVQEHHGVDITEAVHDTQTILHDTKINQKIAQAACIGCFYVESPAMRMLLKKLEVDNYLGLVAASSIIRPGVSQSGMMKEYILRHKNPKRRALAHPVMQEIMPETYGIMVYQEDVIKVAHQFGGLSLGESDILRRGMSGKYRSRGEFLKIQHLFFSNARSKGYPEKMVQEVWNQIESFAGYAFAKGHSASFAVESYQTLYLKTYYPLEYMVAVLNNGGGFYRAELYLIEAQKEGAELEPPCVNHSKYESILIHPQLYLGFHFIASFPKELAIALIKERVRGGNFIDLIDFIDRVPIGIEHLDRLIRAGGFRFTGKNKKNLLWEAHLYINSTATEATLNFPDSRKTFQLPHFEAHPLEEHFDQLELFGFTLHSMFDLLTHPLHQPLKAKDLNKHIGQVIKIPGYLITRKPTQTKNKDYMFFGTFIDVDGQWLDTVHFPQVAAQYPVRGPGVYNIHAKVVDDLGYLLLEVVALHKLEMVEDPRFSTHSLL